jgi:hypothetical protein
MFKLLGTVLATVKVGCEIYDMIEARKVKREYDTTPFTIDQIHKIRQFHEEVEQFNKDHPNLFVTKKEFSKRLNYELGLEKSVRSYMRIVNGKDIPKQYIEYFQ